DARTVGVDQCGAGAVGVVFPAGGLCGGGPGGGTLDELAQATVGQNVSGFAVVAREIADDVGAGAFITVQLGDPAPVDFHTGFAAGLVMRPLGDIAVRVGL